MDVKNISVSNGYVTDYDILRHKITGELFTVIYQENTKEFRLLRKNNTERPICFVINSPQHYEIIGNRIDNRDLWYGGSEHDTKI